MLTQAQIRTADDLLKSALVANDDYAIVEESVADDETGRVLYFTDRGRCYEVNPVSGEISIIEQDEDDFID
jgi:hypothetical protein